MIENYLFDLDGTLADTAPDLATALNLLLEENSKAPLSFDIIRPMVSQGGIYMIQRAFGINRDQPGFERLRDRFLELYAANLVDKTVLFPGMEKVLQWIEESGCSWGVVTNKMERLTLPLLDTLALTRRAACVVCGDTVEHSKPHPAPMLHACELMHKQPSMTLYIGDAEKDIMAGKNADMYTLVARYGYLDPADNPEQWGADGLVDSPLEILDWIESNN